MRKGFLAAATAAVSFGIVGVASISTSASTVWASSKPASYDDRLLPQAVVEQAEREGQAQASVLPDLSTLETELNSKPESKKSARGGSLSQLVSANLGTSAPNGEAHCLAVAVYFESKSEPLAGQLAVAKTVLNRTRSGRFPSSICGVVLQKSQFSFVRGGRLPGVPRGSQQWKNAVAIAHIAQNDLAPCSVGSALFFHARYVAPGWKLRRVGAVGNHIFYR